MSVLGIVLVVILILMLFGGSGWVGGVPVGYGGGYYGMGGLGLVLIVIIVLVLLGRI